MRFIKNDEELVFCSLEVFQKLRLSLVVSLRDGLKRSNNDVVIGFDVTWFTVSRRSRHHTNAEVLFRLRYAAQIGAETVKCLLEQMMRMRQPQNFIPFI